MGHLSIGILSSMVAGFLRDVIAAYSTRHDSVAIEILEGASDDHVTLVQHRRLDVVCVTGQPVIPNCDVDKGEAESVQGRGRWLPCKSQENGGRAKIQRGQRLACQLTMNRDQSKRVASIQDKRQVYGAGQLDGVASHAKSQKCKLLGKMIESQHRKDRKQHHNPRVQEAAHKQIPIPPLLRPWGHFAGRFLVTARA
jgi:hypothetical protein